MSAGRRTQKRRPSDLDGGRASYVDGERRFLQPTGARTGWGRQHRGAANGSFNFVPPRRPGPGGAPPAEPWPEAITGACELDNVGPSQVGYDRESTQLGRPVPEALLVEARLGPT